MSFRRLGKEEALMKLFGQDKLTAEEHWKIKIDAYNKAKNFYFELVHLCETQEKLNEFLSSKGQERKMSISLQAKSWYSASISIVFYILFI